MNENDFGAWKELITQGDKQHHDALPHLIKPMAGCQRNQIAFNSICNDPNHILLGIEHGNQCVAFIHAEFQNKPEGSLHKAQTILKILEIVVSDFCQRQGYGKSLIEEIQKIAVTQKVDAIELSVYDFNQSAISFYKEIGFVPLAQTMRLDLSA